MRRELTELVGADHVEAPESGAWTTRPGTIEETAAVVALAGEKGWKVAPRGGGTRADPAAIPDPPDLVVDLTRLTRVVEHSPADLTARVECGIRLDVLATVLAEHGQWLPLLPDRREGSTLGGTLATNSFGKFALSAGTARDLVIGTTAVRFDGRVVRTGGRVVKNVAGYDLGKLYIGSWGSLGILVAVDVKLAPRPGRAREILRRPGSRAEAYEWVLGLADRGFPLLSAHYEEETLLVGFSLPPEILDLQDEGPRPGPKPPPPPAPELTLRLTYPPGLYLEVMEGLEGTIPGSREASLLLSGTTWLRWENAPAPREGARMAERIDAFLAERGGHACVERMPAEWVGTVPRWRAPAGAARLMAGLKTALDPHGIFPPLPGATRAEPAE